MIERTEIENFVRNLIALDVLSKPLSSLGDKGRRREEKAAKEIVNLLREGEEKGERIFARIEKSDEEKARTLRQGIDAFKKEYPKYGEILEEIIKKRRLMHNKFLVYGLQQGYKLGEEDYVRVMMDLGFDRREANSVYPHIIAVSERLEIAREQDKRRILVGKS